MAVLKIRQFGDPALRQRAAEVEKLSDVHRRLVADMLETMRAAPGVGLAGPQVGVMERIFVWEVGDEHGAVINPKIIWASDEQADWEEGCLSLPGLYYSLTRPGRVRVEGIDENGEAVSIEADELLARVFQHEIDHLDGILFIDHLSEEQRKEALRFLREQALGLPVTPPNVPRDAAEEAL